MPTTVLLNGTTFTATDAAHSWGPLLSVIDAHVAPSGEIVAAVRFDGVDEPGFREEAVLIRPLGHELIVEVDTLSPHDLLDRVLDEGQSSVPPLELAVRELAQGFRGVSVEAAALGLGQLAESLMNLLSLVVATADASAVSLETLQTADGPVAPVLGGLDASLATLLDAHRERDWITVADLLEYDVAPTVRRLDGVFDALRLATTR